MLSTKMISVLVVAIAGAFVVASPILEARNSDGYSSGTMTLSEFGTTTACGHYTAEEVNSWQYLHRVGIKNGKDHCNQWISLKHGNTVIKAKVIDATSDSDPNFMVASKQVFSDLGSWYGVGRFYDFTWKICDNNGSKDACPARASNQSDFSEGDDNGGSADDQGDGNQGGGDQN